MEDSAAKDPTTAKSRSGCVITYAGFPITWAPKLQTFTALSTTEAEYVSLSSALCNQIPFNGTDEGGHSVKRGCQLHSPKVHCMAFEDNMGAIEMVDIPRIHSCMKHLNKLSSSFSIIHCWQRATNCHTISEHRGADS